jgi:hypothetical protein
MLYNVSIYSLGGNLPALSRKGPADVSLAATIGASERRNTTLARCKMIIQTDDGEWKIVLTAGRCSELMP